jgi:hypothetical protein
LSLSLMMLQIRSAAHFVVELFTTLDAYPSNMGTDWLACFYLKSCSQPCCSNAFLETVQVSKNLITQLKIFSDCCWQVQDGLLKLHYSGTYLEKEDDMRNPSAQKIRVKRCEIGA